MLNQSLWYRKLGYGTENEDNSSHHKNLRSRHELEGGQRGCAMLPQVMQCVMLLFGGQSHE